MQNLIDFEKSIINVVDDEDNVDSTRTIRSMDDIKKITSQNKIIGNYTDKIHQNKTISKEERRIQIDEYCKINKTYGWVADKIVLNKNFDYNIDIFKMPTFSNMTYISEKLVSKISKLKIPEVMFVNPGTSSRLPGIKNPIIELLIK